MTTPFEKDMAKAQKAEEDRANAAAKAVEKHLADHAKALEAEHKRRSQEQVDAGDFPQSQHDTAFDAEYLAGTKKVVEAEVESDEPDEDEQDEDEQDETEPAVALAAE